MKLAASPYRLDFNGFTPQTPRSQPGLSPIGPANISAPQAIPLRFAGPDQSHIQSIFFAGSRRHIKVMTWNVDEFHQLPGPNTPKHVATKAQAIAEAILKEEPDVIAFQEVGDIDFLTAFNKRYLSGRYSIIIQPPANNCEIPGTKVAIMAHRSLNLIDVKGYWQQIADAARDHKGTRDLIEATFETPSGYRFTVYTTHLKSPGRKEAKTFNTRYNQARAVAGIVAQKLEDQADSGIILTGDMNCFPDTLYGRQVLDALSLTLDNNPENDLTETMMKDGKAHPTHAGSPPNFSRKQQKHHRPIPPTRLDYMFVSSHLLPHVTRAYVAGFFQHAPWRHGSDHLPVVTVIRDPRLSEQDGSAQEAQRSQPNRFDQVA